MKKLFIRLVAVVSFAALLVGCGSSESYKNAVSEKSLAVAEFNAYQVLQKSGMYDELISTVKSALVAEEAPAYVITLLDDLNNTGVDVEAPMYAYAYMIDNNNLYMGVVAKTFDKEKLDALITFVEKAEDETFDKVQLDGCTLVDLDRNVALGYNETAVVLGAIERLDYYGKRSRVDVKECISEALKNTVTGKSCDKLPSFEGSDVACRLDVSPVLDMMKGVMESSYDSEVASALAQLETLRGASVNLAGNFVDGSIDFNLEFAGLPESEYKAPTCSNDNLDYVSKDAWFVANIPFAGESVVAAINEALKNKELSEVINDAIQEVAGGMLNAKSAMAFAGPLVGSVNGDITVAINSLSNIDSRVPNIDAVAIVPVKDDSIMNLASGAIAGIPGARLVGENIYRVDVDGVDAYLGQKDGRIFGSFTNVIEKRGNSASDADWYSEVKGSYCYVVMNLAKVFANPDVREAIADECSRDELFYVNRLVDLFDYVVLSVPSLESVSYRVVLKSDKENALKQMVDIVKPLLIEELMDL